MPRKGSGDCLPTSRVLVCGFLHSRPHRKFSNSLEGVSHCQVAKNPRRRAPTLSNHTPTPFYPTIHCDQRCWPTAQWGMTPEHDQPILAIPDHKGTGPGPGLQQLGEGTHRAKEVQHAADGGQQPVLGYVWGVDKGFHLFKASGPGHLL